MSFKYTNDATHENFGPGPYTCGQICTDEETLYGDIRAVDTQTPIIMLSFPDPANSNTNTGLTQPTMSTVASLLKGVDWSNTAERRFR